MTRRSFLLLALLASLTAISIAGGGCTRHDPADSSIPWGRPATWEDRGPVGF